jgi:putative transposase
MARLPKIIIPGQLQHVIVRGNNRYEIFCCEEDYHFYLWIITLCLVTNNFIVC